MTNKQILKKAIEKAIKNGFLSKKEWELSLEIIGIEYLLKRRELVEPVYYSIIFSHDFAKCFFGEERKTTVIGDCPVWQWHLCKMVREKQPLKYLAKFLK